MKKLGKIIFWTIWIIILIISNLFIAAGSEYKDSSMKTMGIVGIIIWWVLTIGITIIVVTIQDKIDKKRQRDYEEKYIKKIEYDDDRYGKIIFEHNLERHKLSAHFIKNVDFAGKKLIASITIDDNTDLKTIFDNLKKYSDNSKSIKERIYPELSVFSKDIDNLDKDGNLFEPSDEFFRDNFEFSSIVIENSNLISLWGHLNSPYEISYGIDYDCTNDTIEVKIL